MNNKVNQKKDENTIKYYRAILNQAMIHYDPL